MNKPIHPLPSALALLLAMPALAGADTADTNGEYKFAPPSVTRQAAVESARTTSAPAAQARPPANAPTAPAPAATTRTGTAQGRAAPGYPPSPGYAGANGYYPPMPPGARPYYNRGGWGPWGGSGPWGGGPGSWFGGRGGPWGGGPGAWMNPGNPKRSLSNAWDDMLNAPSRMGEMPGGWRAPSISVPNPVDVGDEFGRAARDLPGQMRNFGN